MNLNLYPFEEELKIMKPCKVDTRKETAKQKLLACMQSSNYYWEMKLDGISIMSIGGRLYSNKISSKTGVPSEKTLHCPHISKPLQEWGGESLILDGELYKMGWKSYDVTSITNSKVETALAKQVVKGQLDYYVYDILRDTDGTWMTDKPFSERRKRLEELFRVELADEPHIFLNDIHECSEGDTKEALADILSKGLEGIVLKSKDGIYQPGKRPMWNQIKLKASFEDDVVIMGFVPATKEYTGDNLEHWPYWEEGVPVTKHYKEGLIGSITIGKYKDDELVSVGRVTGLTDELRLDMTKNPEKYIGRVIIIKGMERTTDGNYRHASFRAFHADKNAHECRLGELS